MKAVNVILKVILSIVIIISLVTGVLFISFKATVLNEDHFMNDILDQSYEDEVYKVVCLDMEEKSMLFPLGSTPFEKSVKKEEVVAYARAYMQSVFDHIIKGTAVNAGDFSSAALYSTIEIDLSAYAQKEELELEKDSVEVYYTHMCDVTEAAVQIVSENWMNKLPSLSFIQKLDFLQYLLPVIFLAATVCIIIMGKKRIEKALYLSMSVVWSASALVFIPMLMLKLYDLPSRIPLDMPALNIMIKNSMNSFLSCVMIISGIILILATAMLVYSIILTLSKLAKEDKRKRIKAAAQSYAAAKGNAEIQ